MKTFIHLVDEWWIYDNSFEEVELLAEGTSNKKPEIYNSFKWVQLETISYGN